MQTIEELKVAQGDLSSLSLSHSKAAIEFPEKVLGFPTEYLDVGTFRFIQNLSTYQFLAGQTVVVVGGATGIGEKIAAISAAAGANVVVLDIAPDIVEKFADNPRILGVRCNITDQNQVKEAIGQIGVFQKIALVAGYFGKVRPEVGKLDSGDMLRHLEINACGIGYALDAACAGLMSSLNAGLDPAISTILTKNILNPSHATYAASKAAELGLLKFYENELPKLIEKSRKSDGDVSVLPRSISYWPDNVIDTPLWGTTPEERLKNLTASYAKRGMTYEEGMKFPNPCGQLITSWNIAAAVVDDWQPLSRLKHGTSVHMNGGSVPIQLV